jgi:hypothetical protein
MKVNALRGKKTQVSWMSVLSSSAARKRILIVIFGILSFVTLAAFLSLAFLLFAPGL